MPSSDWECQHAWIAGMMYVDDADADAVSAVREVTCEACETTYDSAVHSIFN